MSRPAPMVKQFSPVRQEQEQRRRRRQGGGAGWVLRFQQQQQQQLKDDIVGRTICTMVKKDEKSFWDDMIPALIKFRKEHGHTKVRRKHGELYEWMETIRKKYSHQIDVKTGKQIADPPTVSSSDDMKKKQKKKTGKKGREYLSKEQIELLQELDFPWKSPRNRNFNEMYKRLEEFKSIHNHTLVTEHDVDDEELYAWTNQIRKKYGHQIRNTTSPALQKQVLSAEKLKALEDIGFVWNRPRKSNKFTHRKSKRWDEMLPKLIAYKEKHGHAFIKPDDPDQELYKWTFSLRMNYGWQILNRTDVDVTQKRSRLSEEKLQKLHEIGFEWENRDMAWQRRYDELKEFYDTHGHCCVPHQENPQLSDFVINQRRDYQQYVKGNGAGMTPKRVEALAKLDFDFFKERDKIWEDRFEDLLLYWDRYNTSDVPQHFTSNRQLGLWCMNLRAAYKEQENRPHSWLTEDRIQDLEELGFKWNINDSRWKEKLEELLDYQEEHGTVQVDPSLTSKKKLRVWVNRQRHWYKIQREGCLGPDRIAKLESVPEFTWRRPRKAVSKEDWRLLLDAIRERGVGKAKKHWFDGEQRFDPNIKTRYTDEELLDLWNAGDEDD